MILAIDVGNTNIVVGCIDDLKTYFIERLSTNRTKTELEYAVDLKNVSSISYPTGIVALNTRRNRNEGMISMKIFMFPVILRWI